MLDPFYGYFDDDGVTSTDRLIERARKHAEKHEEDPVVCLAKLAVHKAERVDELARKLRETEARLEESREENNRLHGMNEALIFMMFLVALSFIIMVFKG